MKIKSLLLYFFLFFFIKSTYHETTLLEKNKTIYIPSSFMHYSRFITIIWIFRKEKIRIVFENKKKTDEKWCTNKMRKDLWKIRILYENKKKTEEKRCEKKKMRKDLQKRKDLVSIGCTTLPITHHERKYKPRNASNRTLSFIIMVWYMAFQIGLLCTQKAKSSTCTIFSL